MTSTDHFKGKEAISHVAEAQVKGIMASSEIHGTEIPGSISAATDAARETGFVLLILTLLVSRFASFQQVLVILCLFGFGWLIWKVGRSAWLGWARLERLHRILEQERWEIEHNRPQEREELKALYHAKGFDGPLLENVVDVLMADGDRLLKVMIEEELGLSLEIHEHPLKQATGAGIGTVLSLLLYIVCYGIWPFGGPYIAAFAILVLGAGIAASHEGNRLIPAIVWTIGIAMLAIGCTLFLINYAVERGFIP